MNRNAAIASIAFAVVLATAVAVAIRSGGGGGRAADDARRRAAPTGEVSIAGAHPLDAEAATPGARTARHAAGVGAAAKPTGLVSIGIRSRNRDSTPTPIGIEINGEGPPRQLFLRPSTRAEVRVKPGVYRVAVVEDSRPEASRRWTLLAEGSSAEAVVREGGTAEIDLLVETPGSITVRAPERAIVSLDGLNLHKVGDPGSLDPGRTAVDARTLAWRWLGPGTYEVRGDLLRAPLVVTLAAGERHEAELDLDLVRVVLRPDVREAEGGARLAVPSVVTINTTRPGDRMSVARAARSLVVGPGAALELQLPPGSYTAVVGVRLEEHGAYSDLRSGGEDALQVHGASGGEGWPGQFGGRSFGPLRFVAFDLEPGSSGTEVALPHTVRAAGGIASIDLRVEGEGDLWLHYPPIGGTRRPPGHLLADDGRVELALDLALLGGGAVELRTSRSPGEGEVLLREAVTPGRTTWRVVVPGGPKPDTRAPFVLPR